MQISSSRFVKKPSGNETTCVFASLQRRARSESGTARDSQSAAELRNRLTVGAHCGGIDCREARVLQGLVRQPRRLGMVGQARKSLDDALGSICDAHDEILPEQYTVTLNTKDCTITLTDATPQPMAGPGTTVVNAPPMDDSVVAANGTSHPSLVPDASPSLLEDSSP